MTHLIKVRTSHTLGFGPTPRTGGSNREAQGILPSGPGRGHPAMAPHPVLRPVAPAPGPAVDPPAPGLAGPAHGLVRRADLGRALRGRLRPARLPVPRLEARRHLHRLRRRAARLVGPPAA